MSLIARNKTSRLELLREQADDALDLVAQAVQGAAQSLTLVAEANEEAADSKARVVEQLQQEVIGHHRASSRAAEEKELLLR